MVKLIQKENKNYYQCEECQNIYESEELAKKCEEWCKEYKSCNLEIVKYAVKIENLVEQKQIINIKQILIGILIGGLVIFALINFKLANQASNNLNNNSNNSANDKLIQQIIAQALPPKGFKTRVVFGDSVKKMIECGVIDLEKNEKIV